MTDAFAIAVENLIRKAPGSWLASACEALRSFPPTATSEFILQRLPATNNADLSFLMAEAVRLASGQMSWESLSWTLKITFTTYHRLKAEQQIELLWAGPSPTEQIPARRIDQALYDLIANAKHEILLVTFAAMKIARLTGELRKAAQRGVHISLILEFEQSSEGQLSYDALRAFPSELVAMADVYHWPVDKRERNQAGRPGKLHAKVALVDKVALISSANLTDDAFNRNLEVGVLMTAPEVLLNIKSYFHGLIVEGKLQQINSKVYQTTNH